MSEIPKADLESMEGWSIQTVECPAGHQQRRTMPLSGERYTWFQRFHATVDLKVVTPPAQAFRAAFPPGPAPIVATNLDVIAQAVLNEKETENDK